MDLKLGHYAKDGIEVTDVQGEIGACIAPRLRELLIELAGKGSCQLVVNPDKAGFPGSAGLGVLAGGLTRISAPVLRPLGQANSKRSWRLSHQGTAVSPGRLASRRTGE